MRNVFNYINNFFYELEIYEDINNGKHYKQDIHNAVKLFIENPSVNTAFDVYENFFNSYWIGIQEENNPFIELLNKMKDYVQNTFSKSHLVGVNGATGAVI